MPAMTIILEGDDSFKDWADRDMIHLGNDAPAIRVAALKGGMSSGKPSVMIGIDIGGGKVVMAETSMRLFLSAARAFRARFGDVDLED